MTEIRAFWTNPEAEELFGKCEARMAELYALRAEAHQTMTGDELARWLEDHAATCRRFRKYMADLYSRFTRPAVLISRDKARELGLIP